MAIKSQYMSIMVGSRVKAGPHPAQKTGAARAGTQNDSTGLLFLNA
jgi:hypothetical protein